MHYYKRNIGDYHKKAGRLSMIEHGAYTLLIDACYDRERFPTRDDAIDWLWARSDEEIAAIDFVLSKFFHLQDDGTYTQDHIQDELDAYHAMAETNQRIAREREAKRREARNKKKGLAGNQDKGARSVHEACDNVNEAPPNQEPSTINQELETNNQQKDLDGFDVVYKKLKEKLVVSGVIPIGKPVIDEHLRPEIYSFVAWCKKKDMQDYQMDNAVVAFFKKKDIEDRKKYYTPAADLTGRYYNEDNYQKAIPVTKEQAAAIEAKHAETLLGLGF